MPVDKDIRTTSGRRLSANVLGVIATVTGLSLLLFFFIFAITVQRSPFALLDFFQRSYRLRHEPRLILWAWEYPADLRFIDSSKTGVAFLAGRMCLTGDNVLVKPRLQSLRVSPGTYMMAVIRVEADRANTPTLSEEQGGQLVAKVNQILSLRPIDALQIDFDARQSEREFYIKFLGNLRNHMPPSMPLSITSLASWCLRDNWIADMPCDEVVPMFFCMGTDRRRALSCLGSDRGLAKLPMPESIGLSVEEPDVVATLKTLTPHIYLFSPHGWNSNRAITWARTIESGGSNWKDLSENRLPP
jgi:hypothetical protein